MVRVVNLVVLACVLRATTKLVNFFWGGKKSAHP